MQNTVSPLLPGSEKVEYYLKLIRGNVPTNGDSISNDFGALTLDMVWELMDLVWDEFECSNINIDHSKLELYYQHPVWLLNGYFIENHELSLDYRHGIVNWIVEHELNHVIDYGGGFGTFARMLTEESSKIEVDIYEPFPSQDAYDLCLDYPRVRFVDKLDIEYDCLVSTDVLEHVPDPLGLLATMVDSVRNEGYLLIANHFYPSIKCHLPMTFHLRYSFDLFAGMMGLEKVGYCSNQYASIYKKIHEKPIKWRKIRFFERISIVYYSIVIKLKAILSTFRKYS